MTAESQTIRVGLAYDSSGGEVTSTVFIDAPLPTSDFMPSGDDTGAWVSVLDQAGRAVFHQPLPDPEIGGESVDEDGRIRRLDLEKKRRRSIVVELPWPGRGAEVVLHVRSGGTRPTRRGAAAASAAVARIALDPAPVRLTRGPGLVRYERWGHDNPKALTLLFLPDGFTEAELPAFAGIVAKTLDAIEAASPFDRFLSALKAARIDMASRASGIGSTPRDTCFKGRFTIPRVIDIEQKLAEKALNANLSTSGIALVVANTTVYGGSGGAATVFSCEPHWATEIAIHELGHSLFLLADEYSAGGQAATLKPVEANVCESFEQSKLKWAAQLSPGAPLPTLAADIPAGTEPGEYIGAFEGAKYQSSGIYRPASDCKMRTPGVPFCRVCRSLIEGRLSRHLP